MFKGKLKNNFKIFCALFRFFVRSIIVKMLEK